MGSQKRWRGPLLNDTAKNPGKHTTSQKWLFNGTFQTQWRFDNVNVQAAYGTEYQAAGAVILKC